MNIEISGKQIDVGDALRTHVETELNESFEKYAERPTDASVLFSKDRHEFRSECSVHLSTGMKAQASGKAGDIYAAFDLANDRLAKQLRRYKRKLKNHHHLRSNAPVEHFAASSFVIEAEKEANHDDEIDTTEDFLQPAIIAETQTRIPVLSVGEAVLQMELGEDPVLMFRNERSNEISVVYRRTDGNIGWIDPAGATQTG